MILFIYLLRIIIFVLCFTCYYLLIYQYLIVIEPANKIETSSKQALRPA